MKAAHRDGAWRLLLLVLLLALLHVVPAEAGEVHLLSVKGTIGPASADYLVRGLDRAKDARARLVVIELDTPGGLDTSMRDIIQAVLASPVPVATFVSPQGTRAASAGTYLLYASHIAAMAPATNLGAATPVELLPMGAPEPPADKPRKAGEKNASNGEARPALPADAKMRKAINDAAAYLRGLAELRGRNADWAERMVRAIARQAEAERERRAKVIHAEGELQASEKLLAAAEILARRPEAMQLRYLQTLTGIAGDKTNTIVFPVPGDLVDLLLRRQPSVGRD